MIAQCTLCLMMTVVETQMANLNLSVSEKTLISRGLQLINNNVVDLNDYSNKLIRSFYKQGEQYHSNV